MLGLDELCHLLNDLAFFWPHLVDKIWPVGSGTKEGMISRQLEYLNTLFPNLFRGSGRHCQNWNARKVLSQDTKFCIVGPKIVSPLYVQMEKKYNTDSESWGKSRTRLF